MESQDMPQPSPDESNHIDKITWVHSTILAPTLGQLLQSEFPDRHHLLFPWLREQESCMVYAETGVGKSLFALSVAIAVAGGGEFLGWSAKEDRSGGKDWKVLYVDGEMHIGDIQERAKVLMEAVPKIDRGKAENNLRIISRQHQKSGTKFPLITDEFGVKFFKDRIEAANLDLVILDNFSTLGEVEDENSASSFNDIQQFLLELKTQNVATILVHHAGKGGDFRGSSKLAATFETIIKLEEMKDKTEHGQSQFRVRWQKVRAGGPSKKVREVIAALIEKPGKADAQQWVFEESALDTLDDMKYRMMKSEFCTRKEISDVYRVVPMTITKWIDKGIGLGLWTNQQVNQWLANGKRERSLGRTQAPVTPTLDWRDEPETTSDF